MSPRPRIAATLVALALLTACAPSLTAPTITPAPTSWCIPLPAPGVPQGTPYPCSEHQARMDAETLARETEAMEVYTRYSEEYFRLLLEGGADEPTAVISETTEGSFQRSVMTGLQDHKKQGFMVRGPYPIIKMMAHREGDYPDASVVLTTCEDATKAVLYNADGTKRSDGRMLFTRVLFKRTDGRLRVFANEILEGVSACPFD